MKTLIVIPVRGGSVGIPRKATRPLGGIPPLVRVLRTCQELRDADVVVTTDDDAIATLAWEYGARVIRETTNPTGTHALDGAVHYATCEAERGLERYDLVVTVQATSPFTTVGTIGTCIELARLHGSAVTVRDDRGLIWHTALGIQPHEKAPLRITRQQMPPSWRETGAVLATQRQYVTPTSRFGPMVQLVEVGGREAVDLDAPEDWAVAEWYSGAPSTREALMARVLGDRHVAGIVAKLSAWDEEADDTAFRDAMLMRLSGPVWELHGDNTRAEAEAAIARWGPELSEDIMILTSAYHQPRAFLTFLKVLQEQGLDRTVRLWNVPAASRMDKLADEWAKIATYQTRGHCASLEDGITYLDWRTRQVPCAI